MTAGGVSMRLALKRACARVRVHAPRFGPYGIRLPIATAEQLLAALWPELLREARIGTVRFAGGVFKVSKRKARRARAPDGTWHDLPSTRRLVWKGPRL